MFLGCCFYLFVDCCLFCVCKVLCDVFDGIRVDFVDWCYCFWCECLSEGFDFVEVC